MDAEDYVKRYKRSAIFSTYNSKLYPSVMLAQGILESRSGNSVLTKDYNNHFGVKASSDWKGKTVKLDTGEVFNSKYQVINDAFRVYPTSTASFKDRNKFLSDNQRYENAGVFNAQSPEEQAKLLQKAGYATDPEYANKLISLINKYNLKSVDSQRDLENSIINIVLLLGAAYLLYFLYKKNVFKLLF